MFRKHKLFLSLSILGLFFSSLLRIRFNLSPDFEFENFWLKVLPLPVFDYAGSSNETELTSTIVGYLFYFIAGLIMIWDVRKDKFLFPIVCGFLLFTAFATYQEYTSIIQFLNSTYEGQHMRVGPLLFILFLWLRFRYKRMFETKRYAF